MDPTALTPADAQPVAAPDDDEVEEVELEAFVRLWIGSELDLAEFVEVMLRFGADQAVLDRCIVRVGAADAE